MARVAADEEGVVLGSVSTEDDMSVANEEVDTTLFVTEEVGELREESTEELFADADAAEVDVAFGFADPSPGIMTGVRVAELDDTLFDDDDDEEATLVFEETSRVGLLSDKSTTATLAFVAEGNFGFVLFVAERELSAL